MALELGKTPSQAQFQEHTGAGAATFRIHWPPPNSWNKFVSAAGLAPNKEKRIDNSIFKRDLDDHLRSYSPPIIKPRESYPSIAVISDIHWPFHSQRVVDRFLEYVGDVKPEYVFLNGDAWDMYSHSKFPRSHNIFTPREEESSARESNVKFWQEVYIRVPQCKGYQLMGNHDVRPMKRVLESYPEAEDWIREKLEKLFSFDGVKTIMDPRAEVVIQDIAIFHGYLSQLGAHRDYTLMNTINGHTHKGGTVFRHIRGQTLWELNSGLAGDPEAKGLTYTPQRMMIWTPGFGSVDKLGPRFISL